MTEDNVTDLEVGDFFIARYRILYNLMFCLYLVSFSLLVLSVRSTVIDLKPNVNNLIFT